MSRKLESSSQSIVQAFAEHRDVLASYLAQKLLQPSDIEDILQETFVQAYRAEEKGVIKSPKGYLFIVARNLMSSKFSQQSKEMRREISDAEFTAIADKKSLADDQVHFMMKMDVLREAVDTLPPQCRKVFILRKVSGLSQKQIAKRLNISTSTVERHITIALSRLNTIMQSKGYNQRLGLAKTIQSEPASAPLNSKTGGAK